MGWQKCGGAGWLWLWSAHSLSWQLLLLLPPFGTLAKAQCCMKNQSINHLHLRFHDGTWNSNPNLYKLFGRILQRQLRLRFSRSTLALLGGIDHGRGRLGHMTFKNNHSINILLMKRLIVDKIRKASTYGPHSASGHAAGPSRVGLPAAPFRPSAAAKDGRKDFHPVLSNSHSIPPQSPQLIKNFELVRWPGCDI